MDTLKARQEEMKMRLTTPKTVSTPAPDLTHAIVLNRQDLAILCGFMVYVYKRGDTVLYVGTSKNGIGRPLEVSHHAHKARLECTELQIFPFSSHTEALDMERFLIRRYKPVYNSALFGGCKTTPYLNRGKNKDTSTH